LSSFTTELQKLANLRPMCTSERQNAFRFRLRPLTPDQGSAAWTRWGSAPRTRL